MLGRDNMESQESLTEAGATARTPLLSVVGTTARLEGKFEIADSIRIECEVGGEMAVGNKLVIGPNGQVSADIRTMHAVIMGEFRGTLVATGDVEITATGRVSGNIETDSLVIAKGGFFNGNVIRIQAEPAAEPAPRPVYRLEDRRISAAR